MAKRIIYTIFAPIFVALGVGIIYVALLIFLLLLAKVFSFEDVYNSVNNSGWIWESPVYWVLYVIVLFYVELKIWS